MSRTNAPEGTIPEGRKLLYSIHEGKQETFMTSTAEEIMYGGAAGGGKSYALRAFLVNYCLTYPGAVVVLFRRTYKELNDTHILRLLQEIPSYVATYRASDHQFEFPNGSILMLRFCEKEADVYSYDTFEADVEAFDELTAFSEFQYLYLTSRCRSTKPWWPGPKILSATNPGNIGHNWVKTRFVDYCGTSMQIMSTPEEEGGFLRQFIPARLLDNPTLMRSDPGYVNRLKALPYEEYQAKALGNWDIFAGQFFKRWRSNVHILPAFNPPADWKRYAAVDFGFGAPHCVLWGAQPPGTTSIILYREQYGAGVSAREQARRAREATEASGEKLEMIVLDPSMFAKEKDHDGNTMQSLADIWTEEFAGLVEVVRGNNERVQGASLFRECLDWAGTEDATGTNVLVYPRLRVMEGRCPNFVRTVPALIHSENNVEDVDTHGEDHSYDCARYLLRHLFQAPAKKVHREWYYGPNGIVEVLRPDPAGFMG